MMTGIKLALKVTIICIENGMGNVKLALKGFWMCLY
jgi:hypothetical protein